MRSPRHPAARRLLLTLLWAVAVAVSPGVMPGAVATLPAPAEAGDRSGLGEFLGQRGYTVLRLRRSEGNHLEVVARINGRTGLFLLDTGAQISVVNRRSLAKFGLRSVKTSVRVYGALGGPGEPISAALAGSLQLGPCTASPFLLGVSDLSTLNQNRRRGHERRFDGIIGVDLLQNFPFVIDCQRPRLFARDLGRGEASASAHPELSSFLRDGGFTEVAMSRRAVSDFEITADVNRRRAVLLVDTGAAITLLDRGLSRRAGVDFQRSDVIVDGAGGGRQRIAVGVVKSMQFNSLRVRSAPIAISDLSRAGTDLTEPGRPVLDGYLGADFLRLQSAVIDCARLRLYLRN